MLATQIVFLQSLYTFAVILRIDNDNIFNKW